MTIFAPVVSVLTILAYFTLSIFMPIFGYLVPCYKIKKVNILGAKYRLIVNLGVALILYALNVTVLIVYLIYPFLTEFLFYITQRFVHKIKTFDRIIIMSLLSTLVIFFLIYYNRLGIEKTFEDAFKTGNTMLNIDLNNFRNSIIYLKENLLSAVFSYLFLGNIFLFLALAGNTYEKWKVSCYWLLPFIAIILIGKFGQNFNTFIENNIFMIIRYIYTWYGIKTLYQLSGKIGVKLNILKHIFSMSIGIFYPIPVFILGALASFDIVEVETIKI